MECESMAKEKKKYRKRIQNRQEKPEEGAEKRQKWKILNATEVEEHTIKFPWKTINSIWERFQHREHCMVANHITGLCVCKCSLGVVVVYYQMHH